MSQKPPLVINCHKAEFCTVRPGLRDTVLTSGWLCPGEGYELEWSCWCLLTMSWGLADARGGACWSPTAHLPSIVSNGVGLCPREHQGGTRGCALAPLLVGGRAAGSPCRERGAPRCARAPSALAAAPGPLRGSVAAGACRCPRARGAGLLRSGGLHSSERGWASAPGGHSAG